MVVVLPSSQHTMILPKSVESVGKLVRQLQPNVLSAWSNVLRSFDKDLDRYMDRHGNAKHRPATTVTFLPDVHAEGLTSSRLPMSRMYFCVVQSIQRTPERAESSEEAMR